MGWLDGQVALVTGGGAVIGRAIVERFLEEGARVGVMDRVPERLEHLRSEFGQDVVGIRGDVTALESNAKAVDKTVRIFGKLDVFIGNAGVFDGNRRFSDFPADILNRAFDEVFGINVKGCVLGAKASLAELRKTQGCMVFTASVAGLNSGVAGPLHSVQTRGGGTYPTIGCRTGARSAS